MVDIEYNFTFVIWFIPACTLFSFTFCLAALDIEMCCDPVGGNFPVWIFNDNILQEDGTRRRWWSGLTSGQFKSWQMKSTKCRCCAGDQATKQLTYKGHHETNLNKYILFYKDTLKYIFLLWYCNFIHTIVHTDVHISNGVMLYIKVLVISLS